MSEQLERPETTDFSEAQSYAGLDVSERPVEIETGRETLAKTREAILEFQSEILPGLGMGSRTKEEYQKVVRELLDRPDGVLIDRQPQARFVKYILWDGQWIGDHTGAPTVEVGQPMIETTAQWVEEAAQANDQAISPEQADQIAYRWLIWHELGHGLQNAYGRAAEPQPTSFGTEIPASLPEDSLKWGVSESYFQPQSHDFEVTIESERFAEGFAQMLVADYLINHQGFSAEQAEAFRTKMIPEGRKQQADQAASLIDQYRDGILSWGNDAMVEFNTQLRANKLTINKIGYASPYAPEKIQAIMNETGKLEALPWQQRLGRET